MTVTNFPKITGVNEEFSPRDGVTNYPNITGVGEGVAPLLKLIDEVGSSSAAAYSFKQLTESYTGPVVEIRRDSDNETLDFTAAQCADGTLAAFLAGDQGFCVTMYDQTESGFDLVQATEADQPEVLHDGNNWYVNCIDGNFLRCDTFVGATTDMTMHIIWACTSNGSSPAQNTFQGGIDFASGGGDIFSQWWTGAQSPSWKGNGNSDFDWIDKMPRQHVWKWLNGTESCFEFGSQGSFTRSVTNPTYARLTVGKNDIQNGNFKFYELAFFPSDASVTPMFAATKSNFSSWFTIPVLRLNIGDSITAAGFVNVTLQWTQKLYDSLSATGFWFSRALGGTTLQHCLDNHERLTFFFEEFNYSSAVVTIFLGTNDIVEGADGATTLERLEDVCDLLTAAAALKGVALTINVVTAIDRTRDDPFTAERAIFNNGIIANANSKWTNVVDTTGTAELEDSTNATYFVDGTHLTDAGETILAGLIEAVF